MAAAEERCRNCGATLAADARFCARCGRMRGEAAAPTLVDLSPLTPVVAPAEQRAMVATRPPDRRRTLVVVATVVVLALVAFGLSRLLADDGADDAAPLPTTTTEPVDDGEPTTTAAASTSTSPTTTVAPATSAGPTVAPTTTIPYVNQRRGLVLDETQQGRSLYIANVGTLVRVDLGTGLVTTRDGLNGVLGGPLWVTADRLIALGSSVRSLRADLTGEVEERRLPTGYGVWPIDVNDGGGFWTIDYPESALERPHVRRYGADGSVTDDRTLPAGLGVRGFASGRVVLASAGRIWTVGADERLVPYANGDVAMVQNGWILWVSCTDAGRCTYHLGTGTTPDTGRTSLETAYLYAYFGEGGGYAQGLSPDGATIVASVAATPDGLPRIVDLATGSLLETAAQGSPYFAWSPDGSWLVEVSGTRAFATNVRTGARRTLSVPGLNGASLTGVAIG